MSAAHDIIELLPDDVHAEVVEGEVIVNAATPAGRHAKIVLAVRRAFARHGIDNLFENTTLLVEPGRVRVRAGSRALARAPH